MCNPKNTENNLPPKKSTSKDTGKNNMFYGAPQILFEFAKDLRNNQTDAERSLWFFLKEKQIQCVRFKRQHPIFHFVADFYCHWAKLIIEVDGGYHKLEKQYEYDINRDIELKNFGLIVLRIANEQVFLNTEEVIEKIKARVTERITTD